MQTMNRRALLTAAPALLLTPGLGPAPAAASLSVEEQMQEHVAALMDFVKDGAPSEFPRMGDLWISSFGDGTFTFGGCAFAEGEFRNGDRYGRLKDGRWEAVT